MDSKRIESKEEFLKFMSDAGFKSKTEFARFTNIPYPSVNAWGGRADFPCYLKTLLLALIKSHKYDMLLQGNNLFSENDSLKNENAELKKKIESLESEVAKFNVLKQSLNVINEYRNIANVANDII